MCYHLDMEEIRPPQFSTLGVETPEKPNWLKHVVKTARAAMAAFMLTLPSTVEAAQLGSYDWAEGVAKLTAETAAKQKEYASLAIKIDDRHVLWTDVVSGEERRMYKNDDWDAFVAMQIEEKLQRLDIAQMALAHSDPSLTVCRVHTHPHISEVYYGPSSSDLLNHLNFRIELETLLSGTDASAIDIVGVVIDERGLWYYQANQVSERMYYQVLAQLDQSDLSERMIEASAAHSQIVRDETASPADKALADEHLSQLYDSYGFSVRFVPHEKVPAEPICAGPHYKSTETG